MLPLTDLLFINEVEGEQMTGEQEPQRILEKLRSRNCGMEVILTLGEKGVYFQKGEKRIFQESFPVAVKDTTAAGDTFTGYYLAEKMRGKTPEECLETACAAAALAVTKKGAVPSIPKQAEVLAFLKTRKDES